MRHSYRGQFGTRVVRLHMAWPSCVAVKLVRLPHLYVLYLDRCVELRRRSPSTFHAAPDIEFDPKVRERTTAAIVEAVAWASDLERGGTRLYESRGKTFREQVGDPAHAVSIIAGPILQNALEDGLGLEVLGIRGIGRSKILDALGCDVIQSHRDIERDFERA